MTTTTNPPPRKYPPDELVQRRMRQAIRLLRKFADGRQIIIDLGTLVADPPENDLAEQPLVKFGPGGDYVRNIYPEDL